MRRQRRTSQSGAVVGLLVLILGSAGFLGGTTWADPQYTSQFPLDECTFSNTGRNLFFSIRPGD